jgi:EAL domain-containing protein (putative c-di-GMP-specific phosphodiesterase class I)
VQHTNGGDRLGADVGGGHEAVLAEREFDQILRQRRLQTVFQPVVHLGSDAIVGYEALVRGPHGSSLASAASLLAMAYRTDRVVELDWVARASACRAAMAAGLGADQLLFINIEPLAFDSDCPPDLWPDIEKAFGRFRVVLEVTERSLDRDPGSLLDGLDRQRPLVAGFALDDVGSNMVTLSMLPLVAPAVIKLDMRVTHGGPTPQNIQVLDLAYEEAERTGATILAEGIETAAQRDEARSHGATLCQGNYFGVPGALGSHPKRAYLPVDIRADTPPAIAAPFDALRGQIIGRATSSLLAPLGRHLAACGADLAGASLLIVHLPDPDLFDPAERSHLAMLADRGVMTAVLGPGCPVDPGNGIRGVGLRREPELVGEWAVVALSPCSAAAMLARADNDARTMFTFGITHHKQNVIATARFLLRRLGAAAPHHHPTSRPLTRRTAPPECC